MVNPIIPGEALRHDVDQSVIGLLFFACSISCLITSFYLGQILSYLGRKNIVIASFFLKIVGLVGFILIRKIQNHMLFIVIFAILNVVQGLSSSSFRTAVYSALTTMYPDNVNFAVSCFETASGLGFSFGPAIGSLLYAYGGYELPFYSFLGVIIVMTMLIAVLIPSYLNNSSTQTGGETNVSYLDVLKNRRILFACCIIALNGITYDFLNPILTDVMNTLFNLDEQTAGWLFCLMGIGYVISCQLTNISTTFFSNRRIVLGALLVNVCATLMIGPSNLLGTNARLWVTLIALFISGGSSAHFVVPVYSEIIDPGKYELNIDDTTMNDIAAGLSNTSYFLGQMISYTAGGYIYSQVGFSSTIDSIAVFVAIVAVVYFVLCDKSMYGTKDIDEDDIANINMVRRESLRAPLLDNTMVSKGDIGVVFGRGYETIL